MYDLVVIGAGSGGLTAARTAASLGAKVTLIEKDKIGGECLHTGCVPSKALITIARDIYKTRALSTVADVEISNINLEHIQASIRLKQQHIQNDTDNAKSLLEAGIDTHMGDYTFESTHCLINTDKQVIEFKRCIIASGSKPALVDIKGLNSSDYLTSDTIWQLKKLPGNLLILGAGPIGLELGQALAMLGCKITILERGKQLVGRFDTRAQDALKLSLEQSGVTILYESSIDSAVKDSTGYDIMLSVKGMQLQRHFDNLLVAIGRKPNTKNLGLENINISTTEKSAIVVDDNLRTSEKNIYAVGDCLAGPLFTHWAAEQGTRAAIHSILGFAPKLNSNILPTVTFTTPEISSVGLNEQQLIESNIPYTVCHLDFSQIDKAIAEGEQGFVRVYLSKKRVVLGVVIVGNNAGELIGYFVPLLAKKKKIDTLGKFIQAYPTYTIGLRKIGSDIYLDNLAKKLAIRLLRYFR